MTWEPVVRWIEEREKEPLALEKHYTDLVRLIESVIKELYVCLYLCHNCGHIEMIKFPLGEKAREIILCETCKCSEAHKFTFDILLRNMSFCERRP